MPNWCFSTVNIKAPAGDIVTLAEELKKATSANPMNADYGNTWLGNLLYHIGWSPEEINFGPTRCRGTIETIQIEPKEIELEIVSAWRPNILCIQKFVEHFAASASIIYSGEEPACEIYWTNDPDKVETVGSDVLLDDRDHLPPELANIDLEELDGLTAAEFEQLVWQNTKLRGDFESLSKQISRLVHDASPENKVVYCLYRLVPIGADT